MFNQQGRDWEIEENQENSYALTIIERVFLLFFSLILLQNHSKYFKYTIFGFYFYIFYQLI